MSCLSRTQFPPLEPAKLPPEPSRKRELRRVGAVEPRQISSESAVLVTGEKTTLEMRRSRVPFERWRHFQSSSLVGVQSLFEASLVSGPLGEPSLFAGKGVTRTGVLAGWAVMLIPEGFVSMERDDPPRCATVRDRLSRDKRPLGLGVRCRRRVVGLGGTPDVGGEGVQVRAIHT